MVVFPALSRPLQREVQLQHAGVGEITGKYLQCAIDVFLRVVVGCCRGVKNVSYTMRIRISFSCRLFFRIMVNSPIVKHLLSKGCARAVTYKDYRTTC